MSRHPGIALALLVAGNVSLQLVGASLVKYTASVPMTAVGIWVLLLTIILTVGFGRFLFWNAMHRRFPVSVAYPANALFFPCVVALAWALGEPVTSPQVAGAILVTIGVLVLMASATQEPVP